MAKNPYIKNLKDLSKFRGHCGHVTTLQQGDIEIHHVKIDHARQHYHKTATEYYQVIEGDGSIILDGQTFPLKKGDHITIPPGTRHQAIEGDHGLKVLIVAFPSAKNDNFFD